MRRHLLILFCLGAAMAFVVWQSREVILAYYILSTLWLLPLYYFLREKAYVLFAIALAGVLFLHGWFFFLDPHPRMILLWVCHVFLFSGICYYWFELRRFQQRALASRDKISDAPWQSPPPGNPGEQSHEPF
jgi:hypothetical protein